MIAQVVQAELCLQLQQQMHQQPPPLPPPQDQQAGGTAGKMKAPKPKTDTRDFHMRQGLCLHCGEARHFTADCPGAVGGSALAKDMGRKKPDTPLKKGSAKAKVQQALQFEVVVENSSSTSAEEDEPAVKGRDLM
ncbi:UNVERIFIED_CONTAM: hypothetical protein K2H54_004955 [Gekko kuhli]